MLVYCMKLKKLERYLRVNLFGPAFVLWKSNLPGRGLTKVEKHCFTVNGIFIEFFMLIPSDDAKHTSVLVWQLVLNESRILLNPTG